MALRSSIPLISPLVSYDRLHLTHLAIAAPHTDAAPFSIFADFRRYTQTGEGRKQWAPLEMIGSRVPLRLDDVEAVAQAAIARGDIRTAQAIATAMAQVQAALAALLTATRSDTLGTVEVV